MTPEPVENSAWPSLPAGRGSAGMRGLGERGRYEARQITRALAAEGHFVLVAGGQDFAQQAVEFQPRLGAGLGPQIGQREAIARQFVGGHAGEAPERRAGTVRWAPGHGHGLGAAGDEPQARRGFLLMGR